MVDRMDRIRRAGQVAWALAGLTLILVIVGYVAWYVRVIWPPLILAGVIVFVLNPLVTLLQRWHIPRVAGTALAYLVVLGALVLGGILIVPQARTQLDDLAEEWPELRDDIEEWVDERAEESREDDWPVEIPTFAELEDAILGTSNGDDEEMTSEERTDQLLARIDTAREVGVRVLNIGLIILMAPVIAFFLLVDLPHIRRVIESLIPEQRRAEARLVGRRLNKTIGGYFRGQLLVATIVGILAGIGLAIIGLPFWIVVAVIVGVTNMIPMIGPWIGAVPAVVIALTTKDVTTAIWAVVILAGVQQIDNNWISPVVMKRTVKLHPAVVMLALLAGGTLFGFVGLLLAVPTTAVLKVLLGHLWRTYVLGQPLEVEEQVYEAMDSQPGGPVADLEHRDEELDRTAYPLDSDETEVAAEAEDRPEGRALDVDVEPPGADTGDTGEAGDAET